MAEHSDREVEGAGNRTDDENAEVDEVEEKRLTRRERRHDEDRGEDEQLESPKHALLRPDPRCRALRAGGPTGR